MIAVAQKYKNENNTQQERISAKNSLESYCLNIKETINDQKLTGKIDVYDKKKIIDAIEDTIKWLEINQVKKIEFLSLFLFFFQFAAKEEFEQKLQEVENLCSPIMSKFLPK